MHNIAAVVVTAIIVSAYATAIAAIATIVACDNATWQMFIQLAKA